jgi:hypothetical protein
MSTSCCRAKTLVEYFGEDFSHVACLLYVMLPFIFGFVLKVAIIVFFFFWVVAILEGLTQ